MIILRQKTFNSKSMKALRGTVEAKLGKKWYKDAIDEGILPSVSTKRPDAGAFASFKNRGREMQRGLSTLFDINTVHGRINRKAEVRNFQKKGLFDKIDKGYADRAIAKINKKSDLY